MPDTLTPIEKTSANITAEQRAKLKALFPEIFTESRDASDKTVESIDFEKLRLTLGDSVAIGKERFGLTWAGKADCFKTIQKPSFDTLRPDRAASVNFDTAENLIIEGDNLEVLKILQESYRGQVKLIYIDPPYNTGNDFIYPDNFASNAKEYLTKTKQMDEEGRKFSTNPETNGRFHSDWLNMIYSRLFLARNLLQEDGAIFISIDDGEVDNIRKMTSEIFGEENHVCTFSWQTMKGAQGMPTRNMVVPNTEYIHVYAKNINHFKFLGLERDESDFSNPDYDSRGLWKRQYLQRLGQDLPERTITNPATGQVWKFETPYAQEKINTWVTENRIIFPKDGEGYPARKEFLSEYENAKQLITSLGLFPTKSTTENFIKLFDGLKIFNNPKPDTLMQFLIKSTLSSGFVLDFFAGSGTTGHAVLAQNAADGGNRKFILVQLPEATGRVDYPTIADITRERIRRMIAKLPAPKTNQAQASPQHELQLADNNISATIQPGFKAYKWASSCFQRWDGDAAKASPAGLSAQLELMREVIDPTATGDDLLAEALLRTGFSLTERITTLSIGGKTVYSVADGVLLLCLERLLSHEVILAMAELKPAEVVVLDAGFQGDDALKKNAVEQMRAAGVAKFRTL